ncbi:MAG: hypothetical protein AB1467_05985 [Candidatus Diapherotrites archaeon]
MIELILFVLFSFNTITEFLSDMNLVLKVLVLITVGRFVMEHVGTGPLGIILIAGVFIFVFGELWWLFGGVYLLYMLLMAGISGIIIDFIFVGGMHGGGAEITPEDNRAREAAHIRQEAMETAKHAARGMAYKMTRGRIGR